MRDPVHEMARSLLAHHYSKHGHAVEQIQDSRRSGPGIKTDADDVQAELNHFPAERCLTAPPKTVVPSVWINPSFRRKEIDAFCGLSENRKTHQNASSCLNVG